MGIWPGRGLCVNKFERDCTGIGTTPTSSLVRGWHVLDIVLASAAPSTGNIRINVGGGRQTLSVHYISGLTPQSRTVTSIAPIGLSRAIACRTAAWSQRTATTSFIGSLDENRRSMAARALGRPDHRLLKRVQV